MAISRRTRAVTIGEETNAEGTINVVVLTAVYNDWDAFLSLVPDIDREMGKIPSAQAEIVVVDDGSHESCPANSFVKLNLKNIKRIEVIKLTRNLGNQRALAAGMGYIDRRKPNDLVVVMDADHEDNPSYIPAFFSACSETSNKSVIFGERTKRSEGPVFRLFYRIYQFFYFLATGQSIKFGNFCMMPSTIAHRIASLPELWNHFAAAVIKSRIPITLIPTVRGLRPSGRSDMSFTSLVAHAFNGITVFAEIAAIRLIVLSTALAMIIVIAGFALIGIRLFTSLIVMGWTSTILALFGVILAQMLTTVVLVLFTVLTLKTQAPMIPSADYRRFVQDGQIVYPAAKAIRFA